MMWTGTWDGWGNSWAMLLGMVAFWAGLISLFSYTIRNSRPGDTPPGGPTAVEILEEPFARGEIDHDEFDERRRSLSSKAP